MTVLTTRQRDLLKLLLEADAPTGTADLAAKLKLSPRQIQYDLKPLGQWLAQRQATLRVTSGVGIDVQCSAEQRRSVVKEIGSATDLQLILSGKQRQQLLVLGLLVATEPLTLYQLQHQAQVSRTTIINDLKLVEPWLDGQGLVIERKPHSGICIQGAESTRRQALIAMLWGDPALGEPLTHLTHADGLKFDLADDKNLLPLAQQAYALTRKWDIRRTATLVAEAEAQLGGRFSDDAVLYLALTFAIQAERVQAGATAEVPPDTLAWVRTLQVWPIAARIAGKLAWIWQARWPEGEIAWLGMHLLAAPRNESWPSDPGIGSVFAALVDEIMRHVAAAYGIPTLERDQTLRDGIVNHMIPACLRQRFSLQMAPVVRNVALSDDYETEGATARELVALIQNRIGVSLPDNERNGLGLLLRAAYIRERQDYVRNVIVVCPSGMATAQLLVARLKVHFPRLGSYRVISLRELGKEETMAAHLIITTVPLPAAIKDRTHVIQVHPLLLPQDIESITQWLAE